MQSTFWQTKKNFKKLILQRDEKMLQKKKIKWKCLGCFFLNPLSRQTFKREKQNKFTFKCVPSTQNEYMRSKNSSIIEEILLQTSSKMEGSGRNGTIRLSRQVSSQGKNIKAFYRDVAKYKKLSFEGSQVNKSMRKVTPGE